jgi:hemerythrin-like domain-containing protein
MTNTPYVGATPEQIRNPMVRELLAVHDLFRNQLATMLQYLDEVIAGDQPLAGPQREVLIQSVVQTGEQFAHLLHLHHLHETSTLFPALEVEGLELSVIGRLNSEHDEMAVLIDQFSSAIRHQSTIEPALLNTELRRLGEALLAHLAYEETHVCPLLARLSHWPG